MARVGVLLATFAFFLGVTAAQNVTECHTCIASDPYCSDPYDEVAGKTALCSETTRSGVIFTIMNEERTVNATVRYVCIKIDISRPNATDGVVRSCFKEVDNVGACDFIGAEYQNATVRDCNVCTDNNCNSGSHLQISAILLGAFMFLTSKI